MKVEAWLTLKAKRSRYAYPTGHPYQGQLRVDSVRASKLTTNKPAVEEDEICTKIEVDVDESWFLDGVATIKANIPAMAPSQEIQAAVSLPVKGRARSAAAGAIAP